MTTTISAVAYDKKTGEYIDSITGDPEAIAYFRQDFEGCRVLVQ